MGGYVACWPPGSAIVLLRWLSFILSWISSLSSAGCSRTAVALCSAVHYGFEGFFCSTQYKPPVSLAKPLLLRLFMREQTFMSVTLRAVLDSSWPEELVGFISPEILLESTGNAWWNRSAAGRSSRCSVCARQGRHGGRGLCLNADICRSFGGQLVIKSNIGRPTGCSALCSVAAADTEEVSSIH